MTDQFKEDRLAQEKSDPIESSSYRFVKVPVILLSMFIGFGVTYLVLRTPDTHMTPGDSRTSAEPTKATAPAGDKGTEADAAALAEKGKRIFTTTCQACHQASGAGIPGAFPPLDGSEWVAGSAKQMAAIVLHGVQGEITVKGQKFSSSMPTFKDQLSSEDIAAVTTYVRQAWSNKASSISTDLVEGVRTSTQSQNGPCTGEAELKKLNWD
jgi:mono/diheme cytochrome c family protein